MASAEDFKAKGNEALQAGKTSEAIEFYTQAIRLDGANHVYYSNRSAAYLKMGDAPNALEDAIACLGLNPTFAKGYSRKGAALHALKRYNDSMAAYQEGLDRFPDDTGLKKGLDDVKHEKEGGSGAGGHSPGGGLFGPQMLAQMALDPKIRPYLNDPDVMAKIRLAQQNPNMTSTILQDPKIMNMFAMMMGADDGEDVEGGQEGGTTQSTTTTTTTANDERAFQATTTTTPKGASSSTKHGTTASSATDQDDPMQVETAEDEEDGSDIPPAERKRKEDQLAAIKKKEEGNELYKAKKFGEALAAYDEAAALDPTNMTFLSNKAAVYFTQKNYDACIDTCRKAVELGKEHRAPFDERAKALTRAARAYQQKGDLENAIDMCNKAQLESFDKNTQRLLKTMELEHKKAQAKAYLDDGKGEEAKQRGNEFFRDKKWADAVREYEEAVKRAPKNAAIRNNLAAALCKVMDFNGAKRHVEAALEIDPKYVKAWARKGDIEMLMKEFHKAMESFQKGLEIEPNNSACKEGLKKCMMQINYGRRTMTDDEKKEQAAHAMADPQIQAILTDPVVQQVLRDLQENPSTAQNALRDPLMRGKIEKLIAAGIIDTA